MQRVLIAAGGGLLLGILSAAAVAGHGELVLQLGAERIQAGGTIEVRGDLGSGEAFEVVLISQVDGTRRLIATIPATEEGHFESYVTVPADTASGDYWVDVAVGSVVARARLTIFGRPLGADEGGRPEQEEGLVQSLPSGFGPAASPEVGGGAAIGPGPTATRADGTDVAGSGYSGRSPLDKVSIAAAIAIASAGCAGAMFIVAHRRRVG